MSSVVLGRNTVYFQYVSSNLISKLLERGGLYTYEELAEMVGLKPTHNFKRRVRQMADLNQLVREVVYTERGNLEFRFGLPEAVIEEGHPF